MKVVSKADSSANGTCQKPEFASNFENILGSDNYPRVYSTEGISCRSRRTLSFNVVKSTQILTSSFFGTTSGKATRHGTLIAKCWASSLRAIL